jgi:ABC-type amino acid transport substrate-binding protein
MEFLIPFKFINSVGWRLISLYILISVAATHAEELKVFTFSMPKNDTSDFEPTAFYNKINKELLKSKMKIEIVKLPMLRSLYELNEGNIDGDMARGPYFSHSERFKNIYQVPVEITEVAYRVAVLRDSEIQKFTEIKSDAIAGIIRGDISAGEISKSFKRVEGDNYRQLVNILRLKRINFFLIPEIEGEILLYQPKTSEIKLLSERLLKLKIYPLLNVKHRGSVFEKEFIRILKKIKEKNLFLEIIKKKKLKDTMPSSPNLIEHNPVP